MIYNVKCRQQMHLNYNVKCRDPIRLNDLEREMPLPKTFVAVSPTFKNEQTRLSWNAHNSGFGLNTCKSYPFERGRDDTQNDTAKSAANSLRSQTTAITNHRGYKFTETTTITNHRGHKPS